MFAALTATLRAAASGLVEAIREALRPTSAVAGFARDAFRTRAELLAENALLRQQLIVATRKARRPPLTTTDRGLMVLTAPSADPTLDGGVLGLPPCACGSVEYLIRAPAGEPPHPALGSLGHLHRLVVDALVDEVKERRKGGRKPKPFAAAMKARLGTDALSQWFPRGLKVELQQQAEPEADNTMEHP